VRLALLGSLPRGERYLPTPRQSLTFIRSRERVGSPNVWDHFELRKRIDLAIEFRRDPKLTNAWLRLCLFWSSNVVSVFKFDVLSKFNRNAMDDDTAFAIAVARDFLADPKDIGVSLIRALEELPDGLQYAIGRCHPDLGDEIAVMCGARDLTNREILMGIQPRLDYSRARPFCARLNYRDRSLAILHFLQPCIERWGDLAAAIAIATRSFFSCVEKQTFAAEVPSTPSTIGRNIDLLRKECGLTFDELAELTEQSKQAVWAHVNKGVRPHISTLPRYADTFSRKLGRKVTIEELETSPKSADES